MTISEIAKLAEVSSAAVSRYMNGGSLSEEKKMKIQKVIAETGYVPSYSARMLRTNKSFQIGVIVPKIHSDSVSRVITGINKVVIEKNYHMFLASTDNHCEREAEYLEAFRNMPIDGVIILGTEISPEFRQMLQEYEKPLVVVGQSVARCNCVYHDDENAAYDVSSLLFKHGCKKLGYISVSQKDKATGKARTDGFLKAAADNGVSEEDITTVETGFKLENGSIAMEELLKTGKRFDGIFCATDSLAIGAIATLKKRDINVPAQICVCGVGDSDISGILEPKVTTARYYYETSGIEAAKILISKIESNEATPVRQMKLGYEIVSRESI